MADPVKQEIKEGAAPAPGGSPRKVLTKPMIIIIAVSAVVLGISIFTFTRARPTEAREKGGGTSQQDPETWKDSASNWQIWDLGEVWVSRRSEKAADVRRVTGKFSILVSRSFMTGIEAPLLEVLKAQVYDLIQSILDSRGPDIRKDPAGARQLLRDDILRGLKIGANPNNPQQKAYQFPFNEENVQDVVIRELQETRW